MDYKKLSERIKCSGIRRKDLAIGAGITPKTIDNILAGGDLKVSTLEALSRAGNFPITDLFENPSSRTAGRDFVEHGNIHHHGNEYNGNCFEEKSDLEKENTDLKKKLIEAQERIIKLMELQK